MKIRDGTKGLDMRISHEQIDIIKSVIFSMITDAKIFLFGSRTDDTKKGGDIDLFIHTSQDMTFKDEILLLTQLELKGIERKVDLILDTPKKDMSKFFDTIKEKAILL